MSAIDSAGRSFSVPVTIPERFIRPAIPFHALFNFSHGSDAALDELLRAASGRGIPVVVDRTRSRDWDCWGLRRLLTCREEDCR